MGLLQWRRRRRPAPNSSGHLGDALQRRLAARCRRRLRSTRVGLRIADARRAGCPRPGPPTGLVRRGGLVIAWLVHRRATQDSDALLFVVRAVIVGHGAPSAAEGAEVVAGAVLGRVELEVISAQELRPGGLNGRAGEAEPTPPCSGFYTCRFADWVTLKLGEIVTLVSDGSGHVVGRLVDLIPPAAIVQSHLDGRGSRRGTHDGDGRDQSLEAQAWGLVETTRSLAHGCTLLRYTQVLAPLRGGAQAEPGGEVTDPRSAQKLRGTVHPRSFSTCCRRSVRACSPRVGGRTWRRAGWRR